MLIHQFYVVFEITDDKRNRFRMYIENHQGIASLA